MKVLVTGGTGFVGRALMQRVLAKSVDGEFVFVGRTSSTRLTSGASSTGPGWNVLEPSNIEPTFDVVIHAATPASAMLNSEDPLQMIEIVYRGTLNALEFALAHTKLPRFLLLSTGGIYGEMPPGTVNFREDYMGAIRTTNSKSAYAESKRLSEVLLACFAEKYGLSGHIMRLFAFSGPSLPLDRHFAVGNFVRDAVGSSLIQVRSDGTSVRSYLDERDLADWILAAIYRRNINEISHVGSERAISIGELAHLVASRTETITGSPCNVKILGKSSPVDGVARYVPNTARTRECLGVKETISLEQSIDDMINTHLAR